MGAVFDAAFAVGLSDADFFVLELVLTGNFAGFFVTAGFGAVAAFATLVFFTGGLVCGWTSVAFFSLLGNFGGEGALADAFGVAATAAKALKVPLALVSSGSFAKISGTPAASSIPLAGKSLSGTPLRVTGFGL